MKQKGEWGLSGATTYIKQKKVDGLASKSITKYAQVLRDFIAYANAKGVHNLQDVTPILFNEFREHLRSEEGREAYGVYTDSGIIKSFYNACVDLGLIDESPIRRVKLKKPKRTEHPAPNLSQVNEILALADERTLPILAVAAFAGLRVGDIQDLAAVDVDRDTGVIQIRQGKTDAATREIPIHPRLATVLDNYDGTNGKYFFNAPPSRRYPDGTHHINPRTINIEFKDLAEKIGLPVGREEQGHTLHALRRFFKTTCLTSGVPEILVNRWIGHSNNNDINFHYFRPTRAEEAQWMSTVNFGNTSTP